MPARVVMGIIGVDYGALGWQYQRNGNGGVDFLVSELLFNDTVHEKVC